jgi:hypothetical protein
MFETVANNNAADTDRRIRFQVALALFAAIVIEIWGAWLLVSGRTSGRVHLSTLVIAFGCFAAIFHFKELLLRVASALIGMQAAIRLILSRTYVPIGWLHIVNVAALMIELLGVIIIIFVIVKWFRSPRREKASS